MDHQLSKDLRRYQDSMVIIGFGVLIFGAWTIIKTLMEYLFAPEIVPEMVEQVFAENPADPSVNPAVLTLLTIVICYAAILIKLIIALSLRIYIGKAAIAEGRGKRGAARPPVYLVVAAVLCFGYFLSAVFRMISLSKLLKQEFAISDFEAYLFVGITSFLTLLDLIRSGIKVRRLRKKLQETQE